MSYKLHNEIWKKVGYPEIAKTSKGKSIFEELLKIHSQNLIIKEYKEIDESNKINIFKASWYIIYKNIFLKNNNKDEEISILQYKLIKNHAVRLYNYIK